MNVHLLSAGLGGAEPLLLWDTHIMLHYTGSFPVYFSLVSSRTPTSEDLCQLKQEGCCLITL